MIIAQILCCLLVLQGRPAAPFSDPNDPDDPKARLVFIGDKEADENNSVLIEFPEPFSRTPSPILSGDLVPGNRIHFIENAEGETVAITIIVKPHGKIHYECHGVKRARDTDDTAKATALSLVRQGIHSAEVRPFLLAEVSR